MLLRVVQTAPEVAELIFSLRMRKAWQGAKETWHAVVYVCVCMCQCVCECMVWIHSGLGG